MSHLLHCFPSIMTNLSLNFRESLCPPLKIRPLSRIPTLSLSKENLHHQENTSIRIPSNLPPAPNKLSLSFLIQNLMAATFNWYLFCLLQLGTVLSLCYLAVLNNEGLHFVAWVHSVFPRVRVLGSGHAFLIEIMKEMSNVKLSCYIWHLP